MNRRKYRTTTTREVMARIAGAMSNFDELTVAVPSVEIDLKSVYPFSRLRDETESEAGGSVTQTEGAVPGGNER